jgi:hypothetical protein
MCETKTYGYPNSKILFSLSNQEFTSIRPAIVIRWPDRPARHP